MKKHGRWDQVIIMTYGEFGRRTKKDLSKGTDHGTTAPHFILSGPIKGRFYGEQPPLSALEGTKLVYRLHFKQLYASVTRE